MTYQNIQIKKTNPLVQEKITRMLFFIKKSMESYKKHPFVLSQNGEIMPYFILGINIRFFSAYLKENE